MRLLTNDIHLVHLKADDWQLAGSYYLWRVKTEDDTSSLCPLTQPTLVTSLWKYLWAARAYCVTAVPFWHVIFRWLCLQRYALKTWKIHLFSPFLVTIFLGKCEGGDDRDLFLFSCIIFIIWLNQKWEKVLFMFYTIFRWFLWKCVLFPGELSQGD